MKKQLETLNGVHLTRQMEHFPKSVGFISYIHLEKNRQITFGMEDPFRKKKPLKQVLMSLLFATLNVGQPNVLLFFTTSWTSWKHCRLNVCQCPRGEAQCATVFNWTRRRRSLSCLQRFASYFNEGISPSAEKHCRHLGVHSAAAFVWRTAVVSCNSIMVLATTSPQYPTLFQHWSTRGRKTKRFKLLSSAACLANSAQQKMSLDWIGSSVGGNKRPHFFASSGLASFEGLFCFIFLARKYSKYNEMLIAITETTTTTNTYSYYRFKY